MSPPLRLEREIPAAGQAGCATTIGIFLTVLGGAILLLLRSSATRGDSNEWIMYAVGGGFSPVGFVVALLGLKMFVATRLPKTIVEVDRSAQASHFR
jgi:hypothetical protein